MRKITNFAIILNTDRKVFYPGEEIEGHVLVDLCGSMKMAKLEVEMQGEIFVKWTIGAGEEEQTFKDKEKLFEFEVILFGDKKDNKKEHPAGQHEYPFKFKLPANLPSSFEHKFDPKGTAYVRYSLEAKIDRPWRWNHEVTLPLIINQIVDINKDNFAQAVGGENIKEVGCLCLKSGTVDMKASVTRTGVCPGENIFINGTFVNSTDKDLDPPKAKLVQRIEFRADNRSCSDQNNICKWEDSRLLPGATVNFNSQPMRIPPLPPTMKTKKDMIQIKYYIEIEIDIPMAFDPTIKLPITIGTVPLISSYHGINAISLVSNKDNCVPKQKLNDDYDKELGPTDFKPYPSFWNSHNLSPEEYPPPEYAFPVGGKAVEIADKDRKVKFGKSKYMPAYTIAKPSAVPQKSITPTQPEPEPAAVEDLDVPPTSSAEVDLEQPDVEVDINMSVAADTRLSVSAGMPAAEMSVTMPVAEMSASVTMPAAETIASPTMSSSGMPTEEPEITASAPAISLSSKPATPIMVSPALPDMDSEATVEAEATVEVEATVDAGIDDDADDDDSV